jgi:hypothetical protein
MSRPVKFTDQQFLEQYNKGLNDTEISHVFNCNANSVMKRRWKHDLLPNWRITICTITNPKEHRIEVQQKETQWLLKVWEPANKERARASDKKYRQTPQAKECSRRYRRTPKAKETKTHWRQTHKELCRLYDRKKRAQPYYKEYVKRYFQEHREYFRLKCREYYRRRKAKQL